MFDFKTEHLCSYTVSLAPPEVIGPVPEGVRANFYVSGGEVTGPKLRGRVRPVGADHFLLRRDGMGQLEVRTTIETHDGALIDLAYQGLGDLGPEAYEAFLRGELPPKVQLRTAPRLRTAHPGYAWLHRLFCVGIGEVDLQKLQVSYDVHVVV
jgi:Protein of unknown function (DUF3237)